MQAHDHSAATRDFISAVMEAHGGHQDGVPVSLLVRCFGPQVHDAPEDSFDVVPMAGVAHPLGHLRRRDGRTRRHRLSPGADILLPGLCEVDYKAIATDHVAILLRFTAVGAAWLDEAAPGLAGRSESRRIATMVMDPACLSVTTADGVSYAFPR